MGISWRSPCWQLISSPRRSSDFNTYDHRDGAWSYWGVYLIPDQSYHWAVSVWEEAAEVRANIDEKTFASYCSHTTAHLMVVVSLLLIFLCTLLWLDHINQLAAQTHEFRQLEKGLTKTDLFCASACAVASHGAVWNEGVGKGWQDNEEEERQRRCSAVMSGSEKQLVWIS